MSEAQGNLILCGFMGSGKTTVGSLLAGELGLRFLDLDDLIVQRVGMEIPQIFARFGEERFRDEEHEAAKAAAAGTGIVLATGGGALTYARNVAVLRESGVILYLNPGFEICYARIADSDRPLVRGNTREQLEELYRLRQEKYRRAGGLEAVSPTSAQMVREILELLR